MQHVEFIQEAKKFFFVRRTKWRKHSRSSYNSSSYGQWHLLGQGYYGEAWQHNEFPELVMKISGPTGWGEDYMRACTGERNDIWQEYAEVCQQNPHENLPEIYHMERWGRVAWAVMPRYENASCYATENELVRHFKQAMAGKRAAERWMLPILDVAAMRDCTLDLHNANLMVNPETGALIITDPFSTTQSKGTGESIGGAWGLTCSHAEEYAEEYTSTQTDLTEEGDETC